MKTHSGFFQFCMFILGFCFANVGGCFAIFSGAEFVLCFFLFGLGIYLLWNKNFYRGKGPYVGYIICGSLFVLYGIMMIIFAMDESSEEFGSAAVAFSGIMEFATGILLFIRASYQKKWGLYSLTPTIQKEVDKRLETIHQSRASAEPIITIQLSPTTEIPDEAPAKKKKQFSMHDIDVISLMDSKHSKGKLFEKYCAELLEYNNFRNVQVIGKAGDRGGDIIAWKGSRKVVVQCKCFQGTVPYSALEQTVTARRNHGAGEAILLSNSTFSKNTIQDAPLHQIHLWDRNKLQELIDNANEVIRVSEEKL